MNGKALPLTVCFQISIFFRIFISKSISPVQKLKFSLILEKPVVNFLHFCFKLQDMMPARCIVLVSFVKKGKVTRPWKYKAICSPKSSEIGICH